VADRAATLSDRATPTPRWTFTPASAAGNPVAREAPESRRPHTPRPHSPAQRCTPSGIAERRNVEKPRTAPLPGAAGPDVAKLASLASSTTGPMDTVQPGVHDSGATTKPKLVARASKYQDVRLTEEETIASSARARSRASSREPLVNPIGASSSASGSTTGATAGRWKTKPAQLEVEADEEMTRSKDLADAAANELLEEDSARPPSPPWRQSIWSHPPTGIQYNPLDPPTLRFGAGVMGPYGAIPTEGKGGRNKG
jgi:hypothetical protein